MLSFSTQNLWKYASSAHDIHYTNMDAIKFLKLCQFSVSNRKTVSALIQRLLKSKVGIWVNHITPPYTHTHTHFNLLKRLAKWEYLIFHKSIYLHSFLHLFIGPALHRSRKYQPYRLLWRGEMIYLILIPNMHKSTRESAEIRPEWLRPFLSLLSSV